MTVAWPEPTDVPTAVASVALLASLASLLLCVCTKLRRRTKTGGEVGLEERLGNQQVAAQVSSGTTILPVYGPADDCADGRSI